MTLNGHFALKSGPSSASNGLAFWISEKTVRKFAELCIYTVCSGKNVAQLVTVLFAAAAEKNRSTRRRCRSKSPGAPPLKELRRRRALSS